MTNIHKSLGVVLLLIFLTACAGGNGGNLGNPAVLSGKALNYPGGRSVIHTFNTIYSKSPYQSGATYDYYDEAYGFEAIATGVINSDGTFRLELPDVLIGDDIPITYFDLSSPYQNCELTISSNSFLGQLVLGFWVVPEGEDFPSGLLFQASSKSAALYLAGRFSFDDLTASEVAGRAYVDENLDVSGICDSYVNSETTIKNKVTTTLTKGWNVLTAKYQNGGLTLSTAAPQASLNWYYIPNMEFAAVIVRGLVKSVVKKAADYLDSLWR